MSADLRVLFVGAILVAVGVLCLPLFFELLSLITGRCTVFREVRNPEPLARLIFLAPAHGEEVMIAGCVRSPLALAYPQTHRGVVVIADNRSDATARLAKEQGADASNLSASPLACGATSYHS